MIWLFALGQGGHEVDVKKNECFRAYLRLKFDVHLRTPYFSRMKQGALPRVAWFLKWLFGKVSKRVAEVVERIPSLGEQWRSIEEEKIGNRASEDRESKKRRSGIPHQGDSNKRRSGSKAVKIGNRANVI